MTGYSWVSITALLCYLLILLSFLPMVRKDKTIGSFVTLMAIMIIWMGGSVAMRTELWPAVNFWHHVSVLGILLVPAGYYHFALNFLEVKKNYGRWFWLFVMLGLFLVNCLTNLFIPEPSLIRHGPVTEFVYHYTPYICVLVAVIAAFCMDLGSVLYRNCRGNSVALQQLRPIIIGIAILLGGNLLSTFPMFSGIPIDIVSGVINAFFVFYALYQKRLFKFETLFSRSNCLTLSLVVVIGLAFRIFDRLRQSFAAAFDLGGAASIIAAALFLAVLVPVLYMVLSGLFRLIFTRRETRIRARIEKLSEDVSHMFSLDEIFTSMTETIQALTKVNKLMVFVRQSGGDYRVEYTENPLDEKNFYLRADHPLITYLKSARSTAVLRELDRMTVFRSIWESEKKTLRTLEADAFVPLFAQDDLIAAIMLPHRKDKGEYTALDLNTVGRIAEVCAEPLKDAYSYERAIDEARRDKLTGLINRKYFFEVLDRDFERCKGSALSLCLLNLDNFTAYNQLYGTQEGDLALQRVAGLLTFGISDASTAARIGGKEFALILPGYDIHFAKLITENLVAEIGNIKGGKDARGVNRITVSAGICAAPYMASSAKELFQNAETAVYTVKRSGKNAVQIYSSNIYYQDTAPGRISGGYKENANTIHALIATIDAKDHYTAQHSQNVAYYSEELGKAVGLTDDLLEVVREAALLHDIGKIGIREDILNKPDRLTPEEATIIKSHVESGVNIIRNLPSLDYVIPTVLSHHERYDGTGYPRRLKGEDIPILGRILCIADSFDAMTTQRSYRAPLTLEQAAAVLRDEAGKQFDPKLALIFVKQLRSGAIRIVERTPAQQPVVPARPTAAPQPPAQEKSAAPAAVQAPDAPAEAQPTPQPAAKPAPQPQSAASAKAPAAQPPAQAKPASVPGAAAR